MKNLSFSALLSAGNVPDVLRRAAQLVLLFIALLFAFAPDQSAKLQWAFISSIALVLAYILHDHRKIDLSHLTTPARVLVGVVIALMVWFWGRGLTSDALSYSIIFAGFYSFGPLVALLVVTSGFIRPPLSVVMGYVAVMAGITLFGIYEVLSGVEMAGQRIHWPFADANHLTMMLNVAVLICVAMMGTKARGWLMPVVLLLMVGIILTGSRAGVIALAMGLSLFLVPVATNIKRPWLVLLGVVVAFVMAIGIVSAMFMYMGVDFYGIWNRFNEIAANPEYASGSRLDIWASTFELIKQRPLLGWGTGTFPLVYPSVITPNQSTAGFAAHNDFLHIWMETGTVGVAIYSALGIGLIIAFVAGVKAYQKASDPTRALQMIACMAILVTIGAHAQIEFMISVLPIHIAFGAALGLFILNLPQRDEPRAVATSLKPIWPVQAADVAVILLMGVYLSLLFAEIKTDFADKSARAQNFKALSRQLAQVKYYSLDLSAYTYTQMANYYLALIMAGAAPADVTTDTVQKMIDGALERNPYLSSMYQAQGKLDQIKGLSPEDAWLKGLAIEPRNVNIRLDLIRFYERNGRLGRARLLVDQAREYLPGALKGNLTEMDQVIQKYYPATK